MRLIFLGTGASGGTPGQGRSARRESSLVATVEGHHLLVDVTRDFDEQARMLDGVDAVLLTHAHRDASGGVPALRRWWARPTHPPLPLLAAPATLDRLAERYARLEHLGATAVAPGENRQLGPWTVAACAVPHARDPDRYPTYAWRLTGGGRTVVYASDVAALTPELETFGDGADLLVLDGAMYGRSIFSHLRIEEALPAVCGWPVGRVLLTQIGRTAPPHQRLVDEVVGLCGKAAPAHDGLEVEV